MGSYRSSLTDKVNSIYNSVKQNLTRGLQIGALGAGLLVGGYSKAGEIDTAKSEKVSFANFPKTRVNYAQAIPTITIDPNDPNAVGLINQNASIDNQIIYLSDGNTNTIDTLIQGAGQNLFVTGVNVEIYGESDGKTILKRDETSRNEEILFVWNTGSRVHDMTLTHGGTAVAYQLNGWGESINNLYNLTISDMTIKGFEWENYQRTDTEDHALTVDTVTFDNVAAVGAHYAEGDIGSTTLNSPSAQFINCTFNNITGDESVAADLPIEWDLFVFLGGFEGSNISGATKAFDEGFYFVNPPGNPDSHLISIPKHNSKLHSDAVVYNPFTGEKVPEDTAFENIGGGEFDNFVADPGYLPGTLIPTNRLFENSNAPNEHLGREFPYFGGDSDGDGDVDLGDFDVFQTCFGGPNELGNPYCRMRFDLDRDGDIDLHDFKGLQKIIGQQ